MRCLIPSFLFFFFADFLCFSVYVVPNPEEVEVDLQSDEPSYWHATIVDIRVSPGKDGEENESTVRPPGFCQLLTVFSVLPVGICHAALVPDGQGCPGSVHQ